MMYDLRNELNTLRPIERWNLAEAAFLQIIDFVKHSKADIGDKMQLVACFNKFFDFAGSFIRQLNEALALMELLERFPQFDITTPRYYHGGKCFFVQIEETTHSENLDLYIKTAIYTDSETGQDYHLVGQSWEYEGRIHVQSFLDGQTCHLASYTMFSTHKNMGQIAGSSQLISSAFNAAENSLFGQLNLIPF